MKRPKLKVGLAKLQAESAKRRQVTPSKVKEMEKKDKKVDTRIIWHQWSDGRCTLLPLRKDTGTILVVGDGDFSFSAALLKEIKGEQLVCTSYDEEGEVLRKYPSSTDSITALREAGANVLFDFDATKLSSKYLAGRLGLAIDKIPRLVRIIFNFPHTGESIKDRDYNIRAQQKLLLAFFNAATRLLVEQSKKQNVKVITRRTKMAAPHTGDQPEKEEGEDSEDEWRPHAPSMVQSEIHVTCWTGEPYDAWEVKKLATFVGKLELLESFAFDAERYPGYRHCRTIGHINGDETFKDRPSRTYVFTIRS